MRYFPDSEKNKRAVELRERRDKYPAYLLDQMKTMIEAWTDKPYIAGAITNGGNEKLNDGIKVNRYFLRVVEAGSHV